VKHENGQAAQQQEGDEIEPIGRETPTREPGQQAGVHPF
jgi:hypothetical protein